MKRRTLLLLLLLLGACGGTADPTASLPASPTTPAQEPPCPRPIAGLSDLIHPGATLILGEVHGTAESPLFVADVACAASRATPTAAVTVALEIPRDEQPRLDAFLASPGAELDLTTLLDGPFWRRVPSYQDGRSSAAMLALLESLRALRAAGADVRVLAFDIRDGTVTNARDREMALNLGEARLLDPGRTFIVLTGNLHSRRALGSPWDPSFEPMTWFLAEEGIPLVTLDIRLDGGGAWVCLMEDDGSTTCGAHDTPAAPVDRTWYIERTTPPALTATNHDGYYVTGPTTASPPAAP